MGDVPIREEEPAGPDRVAQGAAIVRYALTGDEFYGRVRRPVLFIIAAAALVIGGPIAAAVGITALVLLALGDNVVPL